MYIIVGASNFLGHYFIKNLLENTQEEIVATFYSSKPLFEHKRLTWIKCDNRLDQDIDFLNKNYACNNPKIVYLAACSSPDYCEEQPNKAWDVNITGLSNFINKIENVSCLYFASTDVVYGECGLGEKFAENSLYNPSNIYGQHKMLGEQLVLAKGYNVFRLPLMIGPSLVVGKKHFFDTICNTLATGKEIEMFKDSYRSTLTFNQSANMVINLIEKYGSLTSKIINIASDNPISKYDLAIKIAQKYNYNVNLIKPIRQTENNNIFKAKRAMVTVMSNEKLKNLLNLNSINLEI